jgi:hypothetical protein
MNRFEVKYKYSNFKVTNFKVNSNSHLELDNLTYDELCQWLKRNKYHLFGYFIERKGMAEHWEAETFLRYETEIKY